MIDIIKVFLLTLILIGIIAMEGRLKAVEQAAIHYTKTPKTETTKDVVTHITTEYVIIEKGGNWDIKVAKKDGEK